MTARSLLAAVLAIGCSDKKETTVDPPAAASPSASTVAPSTASAPTAAPPRGKIHRIEQVGNRTLEIVVPDGMELSRDAGEEEAMPSISITARGGGQPWITVESPEAGFVDLAGKKGIIGRGGGDPKFERAEARDDGYVLVYQMTNLAHPDRPREWHAVVARPALEVTCAAFNLVNRVTADEVVAICETLRAADPGAGRTGGP